VGRRCLRQPRRRRTPPSWPRSARARCHAAATTRCSPTRRARHGPAPWPRASSPRETASRCSYDWQSPRHSGAVPQCTFSVVLCRVLQLITTISTSHSTTQGSQASSRVSSQRRRTRLTVRRPETSSHTEGAHARICLWSNGAVHGIRTTWKKSLRPVHLIVNLNKLGHPVGTMLQSGRSRVRDRMR
jgi:hypothetical protein